MNVNIEKYDNGYTVTYYDTVPGYGPMCSRRVYIHIIDVLDAIKIIFADKEKK